MVLTTFRAAPGTDRVLRASDAQLERLSSELNGFYAAKRAADAEGADFTTVINCVRAINRLDAAAIDCGMPVDHPDLETWAAEAVADFLRRA